MGTDEVFKLAQVRRIAASGEALRRRKAARLSCADVGAAIGVDQASVWRWETGQRSPTGQPALRYADLLESLAQFEAV